MENIFIDCEFNGFGGKLISMALISETKKEFYEVVYVPTTIQAWVLAHVIPVLNKEAIGPAGFQRKLQDYLCQFKDGFRLIADWPDDIKYFMESIITGAGVMMPINRIEVIVDRNLSSAGSVIPHNALEDARAISNSALSKKEDDLDHIHQHLVDSFQTTSQPESELLYDVVKNLSDYGMLKE